MNNQSAQKGGREPNKADGQDEHGMLETTAQAIGSTLGSIALKTGLAGTSARKDPQTSSDASNGNVVSMAGHKPGGKHARRSKKKK